MEIVLIQLLSALVSLFLLVLFIVTCFKTIAMNRTIQINSILFRKILSTQQKQLELTQWMCDNTYKKQNGVR